MKKKYLIGLAACAAIVTGFIYFGGNVSAQKSDAPSKTGQATSLNSTPQTLPFSQNWTNVGLITANDDWSGVPGIVGYRGDDINTTIAADLQTVLANGSGTPVDVNANQTAPDTFTTGGISEFEIANPVVGMQGSGTADVPHIVIHLNTTGRTNINFVCNIRDLDANAEDAIQQVNVQYRVGGTGDYANVPGGYIADATTVNTATQVTPLNLTLPAAANNQALVEIRVMTINALGSDEHVGVDDISVTGTAGPTSSQNHVDFDGNGRTDFAVVRNTGGGPTGQVTWFVKLNGAAGEYGSQWGIASDFFVPEDYDGDNKTDIAIYRPGPAGGATTGFYILQSSNGAFRFEGFGQTEDEPRVVGDYDGDGKADPAVYRSGLNVGDQSTWFYRGSLTPSFVTYVPWGLNGDFPAPGDYDGDAKRDFVIQRNNGGGQARFWMAQTTAGQSSLIFGTPTDVIVPGDYDGDGKTDIAVTRAQAGQINWYVRPSTTGAISATPFAIFGLSASDFPTHGDYDGDGKTDVAVWRPNADPNANFFHFMGSTSGYGVVEWGQNGDYPVANYNRF